MNADIKERWIAALTDGSYRQGQARLRDGQNRFCCLGVLADLVSPEEWIRADEEPRPPGELGGVVTDGWMHRNGSIFTPHSSLYIETGLDFDLADKLAEENDLGTPFAELAEIVHEEA